MFSKLMFGIVVVCSEVAMDCLQKDLWIVTERD
jgi:hypothetical protein